MRVKPFAVLCWALGIVLAHLLQQVTQPAGLAFLNRGTGTEPVLYRRVSSVQLDRRRVGPLPFPI